MGSPNEYRDIAQDCLRMAVIAEDERDRPLWVTMAQSWIQLAEHVSRLNHAPELVPESEHPADDSANAAEGSANGVGRESHDGDSDWSRESNRGTIRV